MTLTKLPPYFCPQTRALLAFLKIGTLSVIMKWGRRMAMIVEPN